jgi:hypothetical protein
LFSVFRKLTVATAAVEASSKAAKLAALQASIAAKLSMVRPSYFLLNPSSLGYFEYRYRC